MKTRFSVFLAAGVAVFMLPALGYAQKPKLDLKKIADQMVKVYNARDAVALASLYAEDAVLIVSGEAPMRGREAVKKYGDDWYRTFPDWKGEFTTILFSEDTIAFEVLGSGTFTAPMTTPAGQVAPTGRTFKGKYVFLLKIAPNGLIAEDRTYFDNMDFMRQLGLLK